MGWRSWIIGAVVLVLAGCGDGAVTSGEGPAPTQTLQASCGGVTFDSVPADPSTFPPADEIWDEIDLTELGLEGEWFPSLDWTIANQTGAELQLFGTPKEPTGEDPGYGYADFARDGDRWRPTGWGDCRIQVTSPGLGPARFVLDPEHEPDPAASTLAIQATEMSCASGEAPSGRSVEAVVLDEDEVSVSIVVLVEPVTGDANCPSNPSFPLEVDLGEPLGDRTVFDAGVQPALRRPWPPTETSLGSMGLEE